MKGRLFSYLIALDEQADAMFRTVMDDICRRDGVTEALKATEQMEWVCRSTTVRAEATEIVNSELKYCVSVGQKTPGSGRNEITNSSQREVAF